MFFKRSMLSADATLRRRRCCGDVRRGCGRRSPKPPRVNPRGGGLTRGPCRDERARGGGHEQIHFDAHASPATEVTHAENNYACPPITASNFLLLRSNRSRLGATPWRPVESYPGWSRFAARRPSANASANASSLPQNALR